MAYQTKKQLREENAELQRKLDQWAYYETIYAGRQKTPSHKEVALDLLVQLEPVLMEKYSTGETHSYPYIYMTPEQGAVWVKGNPVWDIDGMKKAIEFRRNQEASKKYPGKAVK